jgi:hypothetical protein
MLRVNTRAQHDMPRSGSKEMANMGLLAHCQGMEAEEELGHLATKKM